MIKAIVFLFKMTLFSVLVLILGNWLKIGDRTISDQIKREVAHAERSEIAGKIKSWAHQVRQDTRFGGQRKAKLDQSTASPESETLERISPSERQKLKNLIQELNSSSGK